MSRKRSGDDLEAPAAPRHTVPTDACPWSVVLDILARDSNCMISTLCGDVRTLVGHFAGRKCSQTAFAEVMSLSSHFLEGPNPFFWTEFNRFLSTETAVEIADVMVAHEFADLLFEAMKCMTDLKQNTQLCILLGRLITTSSLWRIVVPTEYAVNVSDLLSKILFDRGLLNQGVSPLFCCLVALCDAHRLPLTQNLLLCLALHLHSNDGHVRQTVRTTVLALLAADTDREARAHGYAFFKDYASLGCRVNYATSAERADWFAFCCNYWLFQDNPPTDTQVLDSLFRYLRTLCPGTPVPDALMLALLKISELPFQHPLNFFVFSDGVIIQLLRTMVCANIRRPDFLAWELLTNLDVNAMQYGVRACDERLLWTMGASDAGTDSDQSKLWTFFPSLLHCASLSDQLFVTMEFRRAWWRYIRAICDKQCSVERTYPCCETSITERILLNPRPVDQEASLEFCIPELLRKLSGIIGDVYGNHCVTQQMLNCVKLAQVHKS